ncbi:MAG: hypothetical protein ABIJ18_03365 [archaeon]
MRKLISTMLGITLTTFLSCKPNPAEEYWQEQRSYAECYTTSQADIAREKAQVVEQYERDEISEETYFYTATILSNLQGKLEDNRNMYQVLMEQRHPDYFEYIEKQKNE